MYRIIRILTVSLVVVFAFLVGVRHASAEMFTSVASGDWNDGATWGNVSPGVAGTDFPDSSDDATISDGDTVTIAGDQSCFGLEILAGATVELGVESQLGVGYVRVHDSEGFLVALTIAEQNTDETSIDLEGGVTYVGNFTYTAADDRNLQIGTFDDEGNTFATIQTPVIRSGTALSVTTGGYVVLDHVHIIESATGFKLRDIEDSTQNGGFQVQHSSFENNIRGIDYVNSYNSNNGAVFVIDTSFISNSIAGDHAAGLYVKSTSSGTGTLAVNILNSTFSGNQADDSGAGAYIETQKDDSPIAVYGSTFESNESTGGSGGGLVALTTGDSSTVQIGAGGADENNVFSGNIACDAGCYGGGLYARAMGMDSLVIIDSNTFVGNHAFAGGGFHADTDGARPGDSGVEITHNYIGGADESDGNTASGHSGGAFIFAENGITMTHNFVLSNSSENNTGGVSLILDSVGDDLSQNTSVNEISHNTFVGNQAPNDNAGALMIRTQCDCSLTIDSNYMSDNSASNQGGAIYLQADNMETGPVLSNNVFANNTGGGNGGAFFYLTSFVEVNLYNNTFTGNQGVYGGAVYAGIATAANANFYNNIFYHNTGTSNGDDIFYAIDGTVSMNLYHNDLADACFIQTADLIPTCNSSGLIGALGLVDTIEQGGNIFDINPQFADAEAGEYSLRITSPLIDRGYAASAELSSFPNEDYDGEDRIVNELVDIGAYESVGGNIGAIGYWPLNGPRGFVAHDESGNNNDGAVHGQNHWVAGVLDHAFEFDGENSITVDRPVADSFTICAWIKTKAAGNGMDHWYSMPIFESEVPTLANDFGFGIGSDGVLIFGNGGAYDSTVLGEAEVNDGSWHFACVTRNVDTGVVNIYRDGDIDGTGTTSTYVLDGNPTAMIGNGTDGARPFIGIIDELQVYDRPLCADEIESLYGSVNLEHLPRFNKAGGRSVKYKQEHVPRIVSGDGAGSTQAPVFTFTRNLKLTDRGDDVKMLQQFLIAGAGGPQAKALAIVGPTGYFGNLTRLALAEFQKAHGIVPAVGFFGPITRAAVMAMH